MERDTEALVVRYLMEITPRRFPKAAEPVPERVIDEAIVGDRLDD
jgi:hypothetical protein